MGFITLKVQKAAKTAALYIAIAPKLLYIWAWIAILKLKNKRLKATVAELERRHGLGRTETWTS